MDNSNNKKNVLIVSIIAVAVALIAASFAYFGSLTIDVNNNTKVNIITGVGANSYFISNPSQLNIVIPARAMMQTESENGNVLASKNSISFGVSLNSGSSDVHMKCTYDVYFEYDPSSNVYGLAPTTATSDDEFYVDSYVDGGNYLNSYSGTFKYLTANGWTAASGSNGAKLRLIEGAEIKSFGEEVVQTSTHTFSFYNLNVSQEQLADKSFVGKIYADNVICENLPSAKDSILANSNKKYNNPDFTQVATTDEGVFKMEDDLGMSYYFRGAVNNNWVVFGEESGNPIYWRIIRVNGDGSIRMIYSGTTAPTESEAVVMTGSGTALTTTTNFNSLVNSTALAELSGFQYILNNAHGYGKCTTAGATSCTVGGNTVYNSNAKIALENWWNTTNLGVLYNSGQVADSIFCNDRVAYSSGTLVDSVGTYTSLKYNAYTRSKAPTFKCITSDDRFTVESSIGNGALLYPIGMITSDELFTAGLNASSANSSFYLNTGIPFFTITPMTINNSNLYMAAFNSSMKIYGFNITSTTPKIRPVISLSPNVNLEGSGTWNDPYYVSEYTIRYHANRVPDTYQEIEYIKSTGGQYINTGVVPAANFEFDIKYKDDEGSGSNYVLGSRSNSTSSTPIYAGVAGASASRNITVAKHDTKSTDNYRKAGYLYNIHATYNDEMTGVSTMRNLSTGDVFTGTQTSTSAGATAQVRVFALYTSQTHSGMSLYDLKLWNNGDFVRHFVPAVLLDNNTVGLYDTINDTFYENAGSGSFSYPENYKEHVEYQNINLGGGYLKGSNAFVNGKKTLVEWNTSPNGTGDSYEPSKFVSGISSGETIDLYAIWE